MRGGERPKAEPRPSNIEVQSGSVAQRREEAKALSKSLRDCEKKKKKKDRKGKEEEAVVESERGV